METADIKDFSDLGDEVFFIYKGVKYAIAQPTRADMTKMLRVNQRISAHVNKHQPNPDAPAAEGDGDQSVTDMDDLFKMQQEFVLLGVRKVSEAGQRLELTQQELDEWPMKLMHKVIRMVNEVLSSGPDKEERPT